MVGKRDLFDSVLGGEEDRTLLDGVLGGEEDRTLLDGVLFVCWTVYLMVNVARVGLCRVRTREVL